MKKMKKILFWFGLFVAITSIVLAKPLNNCDEMWNFNIARCISNGLVPYKDISMIVTPLAGFIEAIFLKIFGSEMFVARLLAIALMMVNFILIYKIFRKLDIKEELSYLLMVGIAFLIQDYIYMDYNFVLLTLSLILVLLDLKYKGRRSRKIQIIIGALGGLCICTKQTIGLLICMALVLNRLFFVKKKEEFKIELKTILYRLIGVAIPVVVFVLYLLITKSFGDFWDYCILGVSTFTNKVSYFRLIKSKSISTITAILVPLVLVGNLIKIIVSRINEKYDENTFIIWIHSLPMFLLVYPIADGFHLAIASISSLILFGYDISLIIGCFKDKVSYNTAKFITEFVGIVAVLLMVIYAGNIEVKNMEVLSDLSKYKDFKHFRFIYVDSQVYEMIKETNNCISVQEKKVYILDSSAAMYMIPMDRYNKDYDLFMLGNFGKRWRKQNYRQNTK